MLNAGYVNRLPNSVNDNAPQSTLRQLRKEFAGRGTWIGILGVAGILAIGGAFDTGRLMSFGPRLIYWVILAAATYATGTAVGHLIGPAAERRLGQVPGLVVVGLLTGLACTLVILIVNLAAFPDWSPQLREVGALGLVVLPIAVIVTFLLRAFERALTTTSAPAVTEPERQAPRLLARLPVERRGTLLALSVEDHYVRVRTDRGEEMILMRLTDAIAETDPVPGLRVHRSHWVAISAAAAARRQGDRAIVTLTDGTEVPVSRANVSTLRDAGLLP